VKTFVKRVCKDKAKRYKHRFALIVAQYYFVPAIQQAL
jgi:hypothetical protein